MTSPVVNFRASPDLLDTLRARAVETGQSVSEIIRGALRESVSPLPETQFDAFQHLAPAATGDLSAIRTLGDMGYEAFRQGDPVAMIESLTFARMAATRGEAADFGRLMTLLALTQDLLAGDDSWTEYRDMLAGEALALTALLADNGVEIAADQLEALAEATSAAGIVNAQILRARMGD